MIRVIFFAMLSFFTTPLYAQTWVEQRTDVTSTQVSPRLDGWLSTEIAPKTGSFTWFLVSKDYAEAYSGISLSPKTWLQFGAGAGAEQATGLRLGSYAWAGNDRGSVIVIAEALGSGFWYKYEVTAVITKNLNIGLLSERFKGTGPRVQYKIPNTKIVGWAALLFKGGQNRIVTGIRLVY